MEAEDEDQILVECIAMLQELLPEAILDVRHNSETKAKPYDALINIDLRRNRGKLTVEVKRSAARIVWGQLMKQLQNTSNPTLFTDYVNPVMGEKLRQEGVNYLDTVGNAYLKTRDTANPLFVWIEGRKPTRRNEEKADHAFTKAGLRITYWLLTHPDKANETIRTIAQEAGASLETVHRAKASLQQRGFLLEIRKDEWKLVNRMMLLDKWIEAYATRLQPGLLLGRYRLVNSKSIGDWQDACLDSPRTQWGGESAADELTDFLRPMEWILYTRQPARDVMKTLRLLPDSENGPIRVYQKFWPHDEPGLFVHPLLVYADLMISQDARNTEVAQKLFETHVKRLLN